MRAILLLRLRHLIAYIGDCVVKALSEMWKCWFEWSRVKSPAAIRLAFMASLGSFSLPTPTKRIYIAHAITGTVV